MEGGRQLHDLPCIPRGCGFQGPATAIETTAAPKELCESCHSQSGTTKQPNREMYAGGPGLASSQHADQGVECVDCHMGAVGQRMTATTAGKAAFDVSFH